MTSESNQDMERRLAAYLAELSSTPPSPSLQDAGRRNLRPVSRRWSGPAWAAAAVLAIVVVSAVTLIYHQVTTGVHRSTGAAAPGGSVAKTSRVIRVSIDVPSNFLTFQVAQGTVLAFHLHLNGVPTSPWGDSTYTGRDQDFAAVEVPYPGGPPAAPASDYYVAYRIPGIGTTHIAIGVPSTCTNGEPCPAPEEFLTVRSVAPPVTTASVAGQLTCCGSTGLSPAADATISFRDQAGQSIQGIKTDVFGGYTVNLPPGKWTVQTTPAAVGGQGRTISVNAGDVLIENVEVNPQ